MTQCLYWQERDPRLWCISSSGSVLEQKRGFWGAEHGLLLRSVSWMSENLIFCCLMCCPCTLSCYQKHADVCAAKTLPPLLSVVWNWWPTSAHLCRTKCMGLQSNLKDEFIQKCKSSMIYSSTCRWKVGKVSQSTECITFLFWVNCSFKQCREIMCASEFRNILNGRFLQGIAALCATALKCQMLSCRD